MVIPIISVSFLMGCIEYDAQSFIALSIAEGDRVILLGLFPLICIYLPIISVIRVRLLILPLEGIVRLFLLGGVGLCAAVKSILPVVLFKSSDSWCVYL